MTDHPLQEGELILYRTADNTVRVEVLYESESFWLDQRRIAELFGVEIPTISYHLKEIYATGELAREATLRKLLRVQREGNREVRREIEFYNLDAIISVGYRVNSAQATQFRIWATQTLREFIVKGFVLDDERLKLNKRFGRDYFDELLERIREIRASERRFYFKITDIYEQCSIDYDKHAEMTQTFFKTVQNKVHWAITGQTAAEIVHDRVSATKPNLGLTNWRGAAIRKQDVSVAKNYLTEPELAALNNLVEQYLVFAEGQAMRRVPMHMTDWAKKLDGFLTLNERDILTHAGRISHEMAQTKAELEYDKFKTLTAAEVRPVDEDFERAARALPKPPRAKSSKKAHKQ